MDIECFQMGLNSLNLDFFDKMFAFYPGSKNNEKFDGTIKLDTQYGTLNNGTSSNTSKSYANAQIAETSGSRFMCFKIILIKKL